MDFTGRHVAITGASTGIGRATAERILQAGGKVTLIARSAGKLERLRDAHGGVVNVAPADVSDPAALAAALEAARAFAPIDGLFCNAGTGGSFAPIEAYGEGTFEQVLAVNLWAVFRAIKQVLPGMVERRQGAILVTGSLASERGMANNAGYVASKHAVLGLARGVALEAAPHGVRVNCVVPGFIDTPMMGDIPDAVRQQLAAHIPQGRMGDPSELAEVAAFLLSDAASHVTGQSWAVDGGVLGTLKV